MTWNFRRRQHGFGVAFGDALKWLDLNETYSTYEIYQDKYAYEVFRVMLHMKSRKNVPFELSISF